MDLFEQATNEHGTENQPLAYRMRPRTLDEYIGQEHIIGKGRLLRRAIQADQLSSVIFYGPPGTGKTTLARVIANTTKSYFATLNAVLSGVKELRYEIDQAKSRLDHWNQRTILFIDEVHRWNKSQQDALLPWVENGTCILIGATTENPYFEVNAALVSRSRIFQLLPLTDTDLMNIARQALADKERGYGNFKVSFEDGALEHLVDIANGDARSLLNALQLAVETSSDAFPPPAGTEIYISKGAAEESIQRKVVLYDKEGDYHFDVISAFIKSLRGSDPDAALYWLARMVHAGEDPRFIFRRMMISACEDVGLADPMAITVVEADAAAYERIGLPEGRFHLTHAALYLATAPKSNSSLGFFDALQAVEDEAKAEVPNHLKDGNRDAKGFGHGEGYLYPHAYKDHWVAQQYLPNALQGKVFYQPGKLGYEAKVHDDVLRRREAQLESASSDAFPENLTYSPEDKKRMQWIQRTTSERGELCNGSETSCTGTSPCCGIAASLSSTQVMVCSCGRLSVTLRKDW
jgi:putative ATPase